MVRAVVYATKGLTSSAPSPPAPSLSVTQSEVDNLPRHEADSGRFLSLRHASRSGLLAGLLALHPVDLAHELLQMALHASARPISSRPERVRRGRAVLTCSALALDLNVLSSSSSSSSSGVSTSGLVSASSEPIRARFAGREPSAWRSADPLSARCRDGPGSD